MSVLILGGMQEGACTTSRRYTNPWTPRNSVSLINLLTSHINLGNIFGIAKDQKRYTAPQNIFWLSYHSLVCCIIISIMTINKHLRNFNIEAVRKQFPGLDKGSICLNNGSGALVYRGVIER